ncbi:tellurite resistance TerB family protein [Acidovorax sp. NCPPB 3576]|uniref:tellurite resistance TerB family protein n=1 Tax=Acidovorax sp. NCPPB 3576 TaxID=2940488 RepID=UPI00234B2DC8|nr:TerB N-terminal domain-containing protein [Acidovorax sp. NCPPB 3576]WCM90612.1 TerB N-terminal domain-containing protein [Acidovorax sp. NCPPB 3576]
MYSGTPAQSRNHVPAAPAGYGAATWIPPGQVITVAGISIPGGMVYVGTTLRNPSGRPDPALIDPSKKVAARSDYTDRSLMGYWPSYSEISPEARHAYLQWLAGGRKDPKADIGYVFLFLYGLERRAIVDGSGDGDEAKTAEADNPAIAQEVRRLLSIYGDRNGSFKRYANDFLTVVDLASFTDKLYLKPVPAFTGGHELPLYLRLALGQCAVDKVQVPAALALAWVRMDPNVYLRTPATRCPEQFERLFQQKYAEMLNGGLVLTKNKTKLKFVYRAASSGLHEYGEIKLTFGEIPDVAVLTGPVKKLQEVAEATTTELDSYSRLLGRSPGAAKSLEGLLTLPPTLWGADARQKLDVLLAQMPDDGMVTMKLQELASSLGEAQSLERNLVTSLARALEAVHVGMEPDVLSGAKTPKAEDTVVLFSVAAGETVNRGSATYQTAALTLQLATAVALADGDIGAEELRHLRHQIEGWTHLTPAHQQRLRAHMRYLLDTPPSLTVLKKKLEPLATPAKEAIAKFMSVIAQADGNVSPVEIKMLEKVYKALGVDPQKVFSDVHAVAAAAPGGKRATSAPGAALPDQKHANTGFQLDAARVAALQQDTDKVSALLANIFTEEAIEAAAPQQNPVMAPEPEEEQAEAPFGLKGLDGAHTSFVNQLASWPEWTREELLDLASDLDLMLDGALERINEAAFDAHDGPLTEGDDPVTINRDILEKVPA